MAKDGLLLLACAGLIAGTAMAADPDAARESKVTTLLAVQRALREGREQLQRGNFQGAVFLLESQIARANASPEYLSTLCEAYRGYIGELRRAGRLAEIPKYQERLEILDPAACLQRKTPTTAVAAALSPVALPQAPAQQSRPTEGDGRPAPGAAVTAPTHGAVRAKLEDDEDPFADSNAVPAPGAIVERAEAEFAGKRYETAVRLFDQAARTGCALPENCREHWGYCRLVVIAEALRRSNSPAPGEMEREVRQAMSLTPKLDAFGKDLLRRLQDRQGVALVDTPPSDSADLVIEVRHTPAQQGTWAVAETTNFRILHLQSRDFAERVARSAEATRSAMTKKWFGEDARAWKPRCDIFIYATAQDYSQATGAPATSPGHSTMRTEGDRVVSRRIDLHCDDSNTLPGVLPHETTHVVLAGRFGDRPVPRWADEGMAVLAEPRDRIERHLRNLPQHRADRHLFGTGQLMQLDAYPDPRYIGPFYAQSVSLVEFLSERGGPRTFAKFLRDGLASGYEPALQRYYNIQGFTELEQLWMQHAFGAATTASSYGE